MRYIVCIYTSIIIVPLSIDPRAWSKLHHAVHEVEKKVDLSLLQQTRLDYLHSGQQLLTDSLIFKN